jgi:hypothetical protein
MSYYYNELPPQNYNAILGWEPGREIASFRRNIWIIVGVLVALIGLIGILFIIK